MTTQLNQFLFNRVVVHQLAQGKRCTADGKPVIRNGKLADPVGAVLVNSAEAQKAGSVDARSCEDLLKRAGIKGDEALALLNELQDVHDTVNRKYWRASFEQIAEDHELEFPTEAAEQAQLSYGALRSGYAKKAWATRKSKPRAAGHKARAVAIIGGNA